ncbi:MAG: shikimate kinase, partial [Oscillospiraceae bacterium]|nr:shikimate kinase [Oscillospiraceae bacterium]
YFRALELELCREIGEQEGLIIACGGGLPTQDEAIAALKRNGLVFWLDRDPGETYYGLDISGRPLAQAGRDNFLARYAVRSPIYHRWADFIIIKPESTQYAENRIFTIYMEVSPS